MLLTITTTHSPATDLGYLLHKNPSRVQSFEISAGKVQVFYPEATNERCTAAFLLEIDPVELVRGRHGAPGDFDQYVNDRPYVASSFLSVAIAQVLGNALAGKSKERQELADTSIPLVARLAVVPSRGGEKTIKRLFEPLGYEMKLSGAPLDENFQEWGSSDYFIVELKATTKLSTLLSHLYVLIPVLDNEKHYWVGDAEVEKLIQHGQGWLAAHPEREFIARRYLRHQRHLMRAALARLVDETVQDGQDAVETSNDETALEARVNLNDQRMGAVVAALKQSGARRVLDLGCGEGKLLQALLPEKSFDELVGLDVSYRAIEIATERFEKLPETQKKRIRLLHGSLMYRDRRLEGFDAAAVVEVIEHLDAPRLAAFERVVFEFARPITVVVTTPNIEYNVRFAGLANGSFRHKDHRFEWSRNEFQTWAYRLAANYGYRVDFLPIGPFDLEVGSPTQMAVFKLNIGDAA